MEYYKFFEANNPEFDLYNNCSIEFTQQFGIPMKFLPRKYQKKDEILGEDVLSYFDAAFDIKCYLEDFSDFTGSGDLFQKFGLQMDDNMNLICPITYLDAILGEKPAANDLLFFEFAGRLFEITHVEDERSAFYLFGKTMLYRFTCKLFEYSGESIATGDADIDKIDDEVNISSVDENDLIDSAVDDILDTTEKSPFGDL